ncbi:Zn peptidase [Shinella sumterensis]|uniref:ImmA/IrrE family metallo-endopeptidase n=1 Tax=Shinella sumterensis TaxID=1967501 RepID=UPI00106E1608|nr:ImmA/IrrE family metallo-endopeptidase [Shinella sumterensis]MCD1267027.1 ImmA/IrrE family metallo-endopeptidase [Shinella sumterensis]TFE93826.1 Zn peptidase [Shinella sumterensis]
MMLRSEKTMPDRNALATQAMTASIAARTKAGLDLVNPICIYALCKAHKVQVRFNNINMEGMYQRGAPSRIHLSARRPLPRRAFNCAHELGHHVFGHGSSIDELREDAKENPWEDPKEFLADNFAGFVLMPTLGMRQAFAKRGWKPDSATPLQLFQIACEFGVGYTTLITHLSQSLNMLSRPRATALKKQKPSAIRAALLGTLSAEPLIIVDSAWSTSVIDVEVGMSILLPADCEPDNEAITYIKDLPEGRLFEAQQPGIVRVIQPVTGWAVFVRIARKQYVGLADFRHLEEDTDE